MVLGKDSKEAFRDRGSVPPFLKFLRLMIDIAMPMAGILFIVIFFAVGFKSRFQMAMEYQ